MSSYLNMHEAIEANTNGKRVGYLDSHGDCHEISKFEHKIIDACGMSLVGYNIYYINDEDEEKKFFVETKNQLEFELI